MMLSLTQAASRGIPRVRSPNWPTSSLGHLQLDIFVVECRAALGPRLRHWSPANLSRYGRDPICLPASSTEALAYVPYAGPLPDSAQWWFAVGRCRENMIEAVVDYDVVRRYG